MTLEQSLALAAIEQAHGHVKRIPDDSPLGEQLLSQCVTDTRAYRCRNCLAAFTIEPDGELGVWGLVD